MENTKHSKLIKEQTSKEKAATPATFLSQAFIFSFILLISNGISAILPFPMPASVIGLILLFIALSTHVVKLEQVESVGNKLSAILSFLFVPSGISLINSLDIMRTSGLQILLIIFVATFVLLALIGWSSDFLLKVRRASSEEKATEQVSLKQATQHVKEVR
ncbi:antiholin-like murein hydrolase modulator LrgA [Vagococcus silagei]|uniref:Antiholin-like protein LrgA n=1 Tax=Vagococcus silagei TaxID=2508885 RepID=A0A4S3B446_9ENTE|nr:antiholin-like murein hydrolase modulator LrgA [Vagococcus silagei]THB61238.1 antiholin-like protein LrgA [Vagococcus silagei]